MSGIWHGANWTFIVWGMLHGTFQVIEKALGIQKCEDKRIRPIRILITFIIVTLAWVFFRMSTIEDGVGVVTKIFTNYGSISLESPKADILFIIGSLFTLIAKEWKDEYHPSLSLMSNKHLWVRWPTYIILIMSIVMCGVLDSGSFIYVNF